MIKLPALGDNPISSPKNFIKVSDKTFAFQLLRRSKNNESFHFQAQQFRLKNTAQAHGF